MMRADDRSPRPGMPGGEMKRMLVLFLLGGGLAAALLAALGRTEGVNRELGKVVPGKKEEVRPFTGVPDQIHPWRPDTAWLNGRIGDETERGRLELNYPEAMAKLAAPVKNRPHYHFKHDPEKADVGGYARIDPEALADPVKANEHRALPVEVVGVLESERAIQADEYDLDGSEFPSMFEGILRTDEGVRVKFVLLDVGKQEGNSREIAIPIPGRRYKVMGVFFRIQEEGESFKGPVILAKQRVEAIPLKRRDELPTDIVESIATTEKTDLSLRPHQELAFYDVVGWILQNKRGVIPEGVEPIELRGREPRSNSAEFRLKPVHVKGVLIYAQYESFEYPDMRKEDAPILGYWHMIISDTSPEKHVPVSVLVPQEEIPPEIEKWRLASPEEKRGMSTPWVEVDAIYYRVHAYEARGEKRGPETVHLPMVIAVGPPQVTMTEASDGVNLVGFMFGFTALGVLLALGLGFMLVRDRRRSRALDAHLRTSRLDRRKSRGMDLNREPRPAGDTDAAP